MKDTLYKKRFTKLLEQEEMPMPPEDFAPEDDAAALDASMEGEVPAAEMGTEAPAIGNVRQKYMSRIEEIIGNEDCVICMNQLNIEVDQFRRAD